MMYSSLSLFLVSSLLFAVALSQDFNVKNSCGSTLWMEGRQVGNAAIPGYDFIRPVAPGKTIGYNIPSVGLASTRFWAKYGCDSNGANCATGDQVPNHNLYGINGCPKTGCQPPIDSLFEATWGCAEGAACAGRDQVTWFDSSHVDGFTIPYKITFTGSHEKCDCGPNGCGITSIDATGLDISQCPSSEDMSTGGLFSSYKGVDLRIINNNQIVGCASPCRKFTSPNVEQGFNIFEGELQALYYCCPTPNPANCLISGGCLSADECRTGPVPTTKYVEHIHSGTNGMQYAYSYDDTVGLHTCPAGIVQYTMEFCPPGSPNYPFSASGVGASKAPVAATAAPPVAATTAPVSATHQAPAATTAPVSATHQAPVATTAPVSATHQAPVVVGGTSSSNAPVTSTSCPANSCAAGLDCCATSTGHMCFSDNNFSCAINEKGQKVLCPKSMSACGPACFPSSLLSCVEGRLEPIKL